MDSNIYQTLARRIREERKHAGLSLEALGEKAGITGAFIAHIEAARKKPTLTTIEKIAKALDLSAADLVRDLTKKADNVDQTYLTQVARMLKGKSTKQKQAIVEVVKAASKLTDR